METANILKLSVKPDEHSEFDLDIWDIRNLGVQPSKSSCQYKLNFTIISQPWLLQAAKHYVRYSLATLSYGAAQSRLQGVKDFSSFLSVHHPGLVPAEIDRGTILEFLSYLVSRKLAKRTRAYRISALKTFFELCVRNYWADVPKESLIYDEDFPEREQAVPRYIPPEVLEQLNQHLNDLPEPIRRMVLVIQECGMRISELCGLRFNCLSQDAAGDWWLIYYQPKLKKDHTISISKNLVAVIQEQQQYIRDNIGSSFDYLFCAAKPGQKGKFVANLKPILAGSFAQALNKIATEKNICDSSGIWKFQTHQFRHTVGTNMINNGVSQHIVQRYLGHETPDMTATYAHIFDSTLKKEIAKFHSKTVNITGQVVESKNPELDTADLQWLKRNVQAQALPNGSCTRPVIKGPCPHANACLTCGDFRTTLEFLDQHKEQLGQTEKIIEKAKANGWQRQVEMNEQVKTNLQNIIAALESDDAKSR